MTRQRALILDIMREKSPQHLTADELFNEARLRMPHIARGTVYRNLKMMELDGEIGHLEMPGGPDRYDYNPSPHHLAPFISFPVMISDNSMKKQRSVM